MRMAQEPAQREMNVSAICDGTVIDHIESNATFKVADILQVQNEESMVLVGVNLPSGKLGRKGIIKIENRELTPDEVNKIALIAPQATLNIISNFRVVGKSKVELPPHIERIVRCFNPRCVTNQQTMATKFTVVATSPPALRCLYCERVMRGNDIILR
jgi:aspartate carbamoyltransferase regulatory subunit